MIIYYSNKQIYTCADFILISALCPLQLSDFASPLGSLKNVIAFRTIVLLIRIYCQIMVYVNTVGINSLRSNLIPFEINVTPNWDYCDVIKETSIQKFHLGQVIKHVSYISSQKVLGNRVRRAISKNHFGKNILLNIVLPTFSCNADL